MTDKAAPPRILVVTNMWPSADAPTRGGFVRDQVEDVRALVPDWRFDILRIDGRRGRHQYALGIVELRRRLARGADLIHAHYGLSGAVAAFQRRAPLVVTYHGSDVYIPWQRRLSRWAAASAARAIFVSERLRDLLGVAGEVIPCGVDLSRFRPGDRQSARAALGIPEEARVVVFPGDPARPVKGHALFRAVLAALPPDLEPLVHELPLRGLSHDQVPLRLQAADAVLVTSRYEGAGTVAKEAVAVGVPVVSVDVGDVPAVIDGVPGCAVRGRVPEALAGALEAAFEVVRARNGGEAGGGDAEAGRGDADAGRRRLERLGMDRGSVARRVVAVYRQVLEGRWADAPAG